MRVYLALGILFGLILGTSAMPVTAQSSDALDIIVTDLGQGVIPHDINDRGEVVGEFLAPSGEIHAFLWTEANGLVDLGTLGGPNSRAYAVNELGQVVGESDTTSWTSDGWLRTSAFVWSDADGMMDLGPPDNKYAWAVAINDDGQIIGNPQYGPGTLQAFTWTPSGGLEYIPGTDWLPIAVDINNTGQVLGILVGGCEEWEDYHWEAFVWSTDEGMIPLGTPGDEPGWHGDHSEPTAINDAGEVVGSDPDDQVPFFWTASGGMMDLTVPWPVGDDSIEGIANDINEQGQVVGIYRYNAAGPVEIEGNHVFLWSKARGYLDLGTPGDHWLGNPKINERGHVVVEGSPSGQMWTSPPRVMNPKYVYLWTPETGWVDPLGAICDFRCTHKGINNTGQVAVVMVKQKTWDRDNFSVDEHHGYLISYGPPSILRNHSFEDGTSPWKLHTNGSGSLTTVPDGAANDWAAQAQLTEAGSNVQLYQSGITLQPDTTYHLRFAAKSSNGNDMSVFIHEHDDDYTHYGLTDHSVNLTTEWQWFDVEFTTRGFSQPVNDARLRFWFGPYDVDDMRYFVDHVLLYEATGYVPPAPPPPDPPPAPEPGCPGPVPGNVPVNPGFEAGTTPWRFYTNGKGSFTTESPAFECDKTARIDIVQPGSNVQLYQKNLTLEPNTAYRLQLAAKSSAGQDMSLFLHEHDEDHTKYGLNGVVLDLTDQWEVYEVQFTTRGFSRPVKDARLRFWFAPYDIAGESYWIDGVVLAKAEDGVIGAATVDRQPAGKPLMRLINGYYLFHDDDGWQAGTAIGTENGAHFTLSVQNRIKETQIGLCVDGTLVATLDDRQIHRTELPVTTKQIGFALQDDSCTNPTLTIDELDYPAQAHVLVIVKQTRRDVPLLRVRVFDQLQIRAGGLQPDQLLENLAADEIYLPSIR